MKKQFFLTVAALACAFAASAQSSYVSFSPTAANFKGTVVRDGIKYDLWQADTQEGNQAVAVGLTAGTTDVVIAPFVVESLVAYPIVWVDEAAFQGNTTIKSVKFEDYNGEGGWFNTIGKESFKNCTALESVTFNKWISKIDEEVFMGCSALKNVTFAPEQGKLVQGLEIGRFSFYECAALEEFEVPYYTTKINDNPFVGTGLKKFTVSAKTAAAPSDAPEQVYFVENDWLYTTTTWPAEVSKILVAYPSKKPDAICDLRGLDYYYLGAASLVRTDVKELYTDHITAVHAYDVAECAKLEVLSCENLEQLETTIDPFKGNESLKTVKIVGALYDDNSSKCAALAPLAFAPVAKTLENLTLVNVPATWDNLLGEVAAENALVNLHVENTTALPNVSFKLAPKLQNIELIKIGTVEAQPFGYEYAIVGTVNLLIDGCDVATAAFSSMTNDPIYNLTIAQNTNTVLGNSAFNNAYIEHIEFKGGAGKLTLGTKVFAYNPKLVDVKGFEKTKLVDVPEYTFYSSSLPEIKLPSTVKTIGDYAFANTLLTEIALPEALTTIGASAFKNDALTEITIPANVTAIGAEAFVGTKLEKVVAKPVAHPVLGGPVVFPEEGVRIAATDAAGTYVYGTSTFDGSDFETETPYTLNDHYTDPANYDYVSWDPAEATLVNYDVLNDTELYNFIGAIKTPATGSLGQIGYKPAVYSVTILEVAPGSVNDYKDPSAGQWTKFFDDNMPTANVVMNWGVNDDTNDHTPATAIDAATLEYNRTFANEKWMDWYEPFEIKVSELEAKGLQVAKLFNVVCELDEDGVATGKQKIGLMKMASNETLKANLPYMVKADVAGTDLNLKLGNQEGGASYTIEPAYVYFKKADFETGAAVTVAKICVGYYLKAKAHVEIAAAEENVIHTSSTLAQYTFTGKYTRGTVAPVTGWDFYGYSTATAAMGHLTATSKVQAHRWYFGIKAADIYGNTVPVNEIETGLIEEEGISTGIEALVDAQANSLEGIYTMDGRAASSIENAGFYIVNGKKVAKF